jgi:hypothetical protein
MGRALTIQRTLVTPPERERFHEKLRQKQAYFEEAGLPGAFLEFFEAPDAETLARAHAAAPELVLDPNRVYLEVELK